MMCTTCGCGNAEARIDGKSIAERVESPVGEAVSTATSETYRYVRVPVASGVHGHGSAGHGPEHWHRHEDGTYHSHAHGDDISRPSAQLAEGGTTSAGVADSAARIIQVERDLLAKNDAIAAANRRLLNDRGVFALNLVSSPGSGKTTLLVETIKAWNRRTPIAVIEGDQQTSRDADRVRDAGARAVQINTGKGCHLDAQMVADALSELDVARESLLLIENVGNLVCPAAFDLGEAHKIVVLSVTEGDDKPLKYPDMFRAADLLVMNKLDLLAHVDFDVEAAIAHARQVRPGIDVILVSARTGEGFRDWLAWLERGVATRAARRESAVEALHRRTDVLEPALSPSAAR